MQPFAPFAPSATPPTAPYRSPPPPEPPPRIRPLEAILFVFRGEAVVASVLMGLLFLLIPIVGPIAFHGYQAEILQRLVRRNPQPLPRLTFDAFVQYLTRGVAGFLAQLAVSAPFAVAWAFSVVATVSATFLAAAREHGRPPAFPAIPGALSLVFVAGAALWVASLPFQNALFTRAALTEDVAQTFDLRRLLDQGRRTYGAALAGFIGFGILSVFVGALGFGLCFVGIWPAAVVLQIAGTHLRWQIYELHLARGGEAMAIKPLPPAAAAPVGWGMPR